ncbi:hypothetical protein ACIP1Z_11205 [Pseudomonas moraviensis]|uniref:hypothetical protein n=1 Tax=Pseudomonas moraviensis TaxID=321662 RepID=UPI0038013A1F
MSEAHCTKLPQRKALGLVTHDNTGGPFVVECQGCGAVYPSFHCLGGEQIADTGDHEDARCPHCDQVDPEECDNAALAWNTQQLKINELQQRLTATDQRNDDLAEMLALASISVDYHAGMKGEDGEHLYDLLARIRALFQNHVEHPPAIVEQDHVVGTTGKVAQPFTEQFLEDHLGKIPQ